MRSGDQVSRRLERRWAPRYEFRAGLEIEWGSAVLRGSTRDISSNGMFIEVPDTLWVGAGFTARLHLPQPETRSVVPNGAPSAGIPDPHCAYSGCFPLPGLTCCGA